eukprot:TRINITY_DN1554_c0_g1_i1.p1 TRINITY_DN1554_c0_g1~~TRINITY_DN1554_c0_g1_i1.p1  ORF type:complete len:231 (+),score=75.55 TRINITY_DN1554_c0_g1_i1:94-786(+)
MASKQEDDTNEHTTEEATESSDNTDNASSEPKADPSIGKEYEDLDILTPMWFYQDASNLKQGPFSYKEMYLWWKNGFFQGSLMVKTVWDDNFAPLDKTPQFLHAPQKLIQRVEKEQEKSFQAGHIEVPMVPVNYEPRANYQDYTVTGGFNPVTGKFQNQDGNAYFTSRGIPSDKDYRMMSHYFDHDQYQNLHSQEEIEKRKTLVKGSKKFWKERKEKKKRAKLVADYLAD